MFRIEDEQPRCLNYCSPQTLPTTPDQTVPVQTTIVTLAAATSVQTNNSDILILQNGETRYF